jgi:hypothetical protein
MRRLADAAAALHANWLLLLVLLAGGLTLGKTQPLPPLLVMRSTCTLAGSVLLPV